MLRIPAFRPTALLLSAVPVSCQHRPYADETMQPLTPAWPDKSHLHSSVPSACWFAQKPVAGYPFHPNHPLQKSSPGCRNPPPFHHASKSAGHSTLPSFPASVLPWWSSCRSRKAAQPHGIPLPFLPDPAGRWVHLGSSPPAALPECWRSPPAASVRRTVQKDCGHDTARYPAASVLSRYAPASLPVGFPDSEVRKRLHHRPYLSHRKAD